MKGRGCRIRAKTLGLGFGIQGFGFWVEGEGARGFSRKGAMTSAGICGDFRVRKRYLDNFCGKRYLTSPSFIQEFIEVLFQIQTI